MRRNDYTKSLIGIMYLVNYIIKKSTENLSKTQQNIFIASTAILSSIHFTLIYLINNTRPNAYLIFFMMLISTIVSILVYKTCNEPDYDNIKTHANSINDEEGVFYEKKLNLRMGEYDKALRVKRLISKIFKYLRIPLVTLFGYNAAGWGLVEGLKLSEGHGFFYHHWFLLALFLFPLFTTITIMIIYAGKLINTNLANRPIAWSMPAILCVLAAYPRMNELDVWLMYFALILLVAAIHFGAVFLNKYAREWAVDIYVYFNSHKK